MNEAKPSFPPPYADREDRREAGIKPAYFTEEKDSFGQPLLSDEVPPSVVDELIAIADRLEELSHDCKLGCVDNALEIASLATHHAIDLLSVTESKTK